MRKTVKAVRSFFAYVCRNSKIRTLRNSAYIHRNSALYTAMCVDAQNRKSCAEFLCVCPQKLQNKQTSLGCWCFQMIRKNTYVSQWKFSCGPTPLHTCSCKGCNEICLYHYTMRIFCGYAQIYIRRFLLCGVCVVVRKSASRTGRSFCVCTQMKNFWSLCRYTHISP